MEKILLCAQSLRDILQSKRKEQGKKNWEKKFDHNELTMYKIAHRVEILAENTERYDVMKTKQCFLCGQRASMLYTAE